MKWIAIIEGIALIACATRYIAYKISSYAFLYYMETKGCPLPTDQEMGSCIDYVVKRMFHLKSK